MDPTSEIPLATFRPSAASIARSVGLLFGIVCLMAFPIALWKGRSPTELAQGFLAAAAAFSLLVPFLTLCVWPLFVRVYPSGLAGRSFWGRVSLIPWSQVVGFREDQSSGLTLVIVESSGDAAAVWTRPDVLGNESFQRLVVELAGHDHPLAQATHDDTHIR